MKVRLLKPWKFRTVGSVLNAVPDGTANLLIRRGLAEEVKSAKVEKPQRSERVRA